MNKIILYNINNFGLFDKKYENYLLDFINNSTVFNNKYGNFRSPISQAHGEDDANSEKYSIDFKRFITQDECRYRRLNQQETIDIISINDVSIKTNEYYDMVKCMKRLDKKDFYNIKNNHFTYIDEQEQKEYLNITNRLLMKDKNIMLFLPKIILMQKSTIDDVISFFDYILKDMFEFRQENVNKDLYFSFLICFDINQLQDSFFVIGQYIDNQLTFIDLVPNNNILKNILP